MSSEISCSLFGSKSTLLPLSINQPTHYFDLLPVLDRLVAVVRVVDGVTRNRSVDYVRRFPSDNDRRPPRLGSSQNWSRPGTCNRCLDPVPQPDPPVMTTCTVRSTLSMELFAWQVKSVFLYNSLIIRICSLLTVPDFPGRFVISSFPLNTV